MAGQGATESGADPSEVLETASARSGKRFGEVWEEIPGAAGGQEIRGSGTLLPWQEQKMAFTRTERCLR